MSSKSGAGAGAVVTMTPAPNWKDNLFLRKWKSEQTGTLVLGSISAFQIGASRRRLFLHTNTFGIICISE